MKLRKTKQTGIQAVIALTITALLLITAISTRLDRHIALAQSGGGYTLSWWTVDNGGGTSNGGAYALSGTIGQPDAGGLLSGGQFGVQGGFWPLDGTAVSPPTAGHDVYLPLIVTK
jgi:hypothetical protein